VHDDHVLFVVGLVPKTLLAVPAVKPLLVVHGGGGCRTDPFIEIFNKSVDGIGGRLDSDLGGVGGGGRAVIDID